MTLIARRCLLLALAAMLSACSSGSPSSTSKLAGDQWAPFEVAVQGDDVYWATFDGPMYLRTCPASGCAGTPADLAQGPWTIDRFAVDATSLYVVVEEQDAFRPWIGRCPRSGCTGLPEVLVPARSVAPNEAYNFVSALTVDATNVYWATADGVRTCVLTDCANHFTTLGSIRVQDGPVISPSQIVVGDGRVYWPDYYTQRILSCATSGCDEAPAIVAEHQYAAGMALDGAHLSWIAPASPTASADIAIVTCDPTQCATTLTTLADKQPNASSIAAADGVVYWSNQGTSYDGSIQRCAVGGCGGAPTKLAGGRAPSWIALGSGKVFWSDHMDEAIYSAPSGG